MSENVFANEWVECLEAHYMHVIRTKDKVTEPSLSIVMHSAGFTDKQLAELRVRATMHIDDAGEDFVPDLDVLDAHNHDHHEAAAEAVETHIYNIPIDLSKHSVESASPLEATLSNESLPEAELEPQFLDDTLMEAELITEPIEEGQSEAELPSESLMDVDAELESETSDEEDVVELESEPEPEDPDAPQQLSLF